MAIEITRSSNQVNINRGSVSIDLPRRSYTVELPRSENAVQLVKPNVNVSFEQNVETSCDIGSSEEDREVNIARPELDIEVVKPDLSTDIERVSSEVEITKTFPEFLLQLQPSVYTATVNRYIDTWCSVDEEVGHCVYFYGPKISGKYQVRKVDITDRDKMPCFGIIISKYNDTECRTQWFGFVEGVFTNLTDRKVHFVGYDSKPTYPEPLVTSDHLVQKIGIAADSNTLLFIPEWRVFKRFVH